MSNFRGLAPLALSFIFAVIPGHAQNTPAQLGVPRFESAPCAIEIPPGEKTDCGYLTVRENRRARNSKTIRLPIIVLKSENPNPKADPILRTLGGPGASSLKLVRGRRSSPWLKDRDVIIFEQRGTKYAQPALECPEVDRSNINSAKQQFDVKSARLRELQAAKVCYDRLVKQEIDLSAYNSKESAADIEDLRRVLKLDKIDLYGVSYSSRLMLEVMRDFPDGIRSVVIESTLPPEVNYDEVGVDGIVRSLNEMFSACRADTECAAAYPDLEKEFYGVVVRLNERPVVVGTKDPVTSVMFDIRLNGDDFATWIVDYLFSNEPAATVEAPYVIHQAFNGNLVEQFKRYAGDKLNGSFYSWGMRYSFWCSEEMPFEDRAKIKSQSRKYPGLNGYQVMALPDICAIWKVPGAKAAENQPVRSSIPTMVLSAQYDAYTPPEWSKSTAANLKNSFLFEVPWSGHGPGFSSPCARQMIADFFDNPISMPDSSCLERTRQSFKFLTKK